MVPWWSLLIECSLLLAYHIWCKRDWDRKEADLLSRVQAGTLADYQQATGDRKPPPGRNKLQKVTLAQYQAPQTQEGGAGQ